MKLTNSVVEEEIQASLGLHKSIKSSRPVTAPKLPARGRNEGLSQKSSKQDSKPFEYKARHEEVKRPETTGMGLGRWETSDNDFDNSENSDLVANAGVKVAEVSDDDWDATMKKPTPKEPERPVSNINQRDKGNGINSLTCDTDNNRNFQYGDLEGSDDEDDDDNSGSDMDDNYDWGSFELP